MRRLSFRARLVLSFALVALVPMTLILVIASAMVHDGFEADAAREAANAGDQLAGQLARDGRQLLATLHEMARDFELVEKLYLYAEPASRERAQASLIDWLEEARRQRGIALAQLSSPDGKIVASGHERARFNMDDPRTLRLIERYPDRAVLTVEEGLNVRGLALKASTSAGQDRARLVLTVGLLIDEEFLSGLPVAPPDVLLVVMADGSVLTGAGEEGRQAQRLVTGSDGSKTVDELLEQQGYLVEQIELPEVETAETVRFYVAKSTRPLEALVRRLNLVFAGLALAGVGLAWLSGLILTRPVSAQVDRLVEALDRVAGGDLEARVEVQREDELGQVARAFNVMTHELAENKSKLLQAERVAAWRDIARRLAHEIKNPLSPIQLSIETLKKCHAARHPDFGVILDESTTTIIEEVQRLRHIVEEFSDFARLPKPTMEEEDIHEVIRSIITLYSGLDPSYRFVTDLEQGSSRLVFDADQVSQVLMNLVKNALEAMPDGGEIHIKTRREAERFVVTVADTGPGLSEEALARLFQPYATTKTAGTGLGLAISHRILNEHGGSIAIDRAWSRGAAFIFALPA